MALNRTSQDGQESEDVRLNREIARTLERVIRESPPVNILIAGRTGVGKSTLINAVFQGNFADTGQGRPVTQYTSEVTKKDVPLRIFDTRGLEMEQFSKTLSELETFIASRLKRPDAIDHIHIAWVCIVEDLRRVEEAESNLVAMLSQHMPVIVVITQAKADNGFSNTVRKLLPKAREVIRVLAQPAELDDGHILKPHHLTDLVQLTMHYVPEAHKNAFAAAQKVDVELKQARAREAIFLASTGAAAIGASPIPFADAFAIVPTQIAMITRITIVYGIPLSESFISALVGSTITGVAGTMVGRAVVTGLIKLIPGAGSLVGGIISAATAAALTTAFGEAYLAALTRLFLQKKGEMPSEEEVLQAFRMEFQKRQGGASQ